MSEITVHKVDQRTDEWLKLRIGKVGGSEAIGLSTPARMKTLIWVKLAEKLTGKQIEVKPNEAMLIGIDLEPVAKEYYEGDEMVSVEEAGYITNIFYKYLGLSPDGLVGKNGAIEIKCTGSKKHIETIITGEVPKDNINQIVQYFVVKEDLDWVDFVSFDDRVSLKQYFKIRVTREELNDEIKKAKTNYLKYETQINEYLKLF